MRTAFPFVFLFSIYPIIPGAIENLIITQDTRMDNEAHPPFFAHTGILYVEEYFFT